METTKYRTYKVVCITNLNIAVSYTKRIEYSGFATNNILLLIHVRQINLWKVMVVKDGKALLGGYVPTSVSLSKIAPHSKSVAICVAPPP